MALPAIKTEPGELKNLRQICRLCLSEESLCDVFEEQDLRQWISDFLSITITTEDQMSQAICDICRMRLNDFNQFRVHCQEVQVVLQSMIPNPPSEMEEEVFKSKSSYECKKLDGKNLAKCNNNDAECEKSNGVDMIEIGDVKIESHNDDNMDSSTSLPDHTSSRLYQILVQDSKRTFVENVQRDKEVEKFECSICHKVMQTHRALYDHDKYVHGPKKHVCKFCRVSFSVAAELKRHLLCKKHLKRMRFFSDLKATVNVQHDSIQKCSESNTVSDLKPQVTIDISDDEYSCPKCNEVFNRQCELKNHMRTHDAKSEEDQSNDMEEEC